MSKKFTYLKRDGTGDVIKADEFVGTKPEENIVRADDLERIKAFINGKVDSFLNEGTDINDQDTDWTNETELKSLLDKGELVNIKSLGLGSAAGIIGTFDADGRITMVGIHLAPDPTGDDIGVIEITFDATGKITGINMFTRYAKFDLSNVNVGVANAGKIARVKADGTLEWIEQAFQNISDLTTQDEVFNKVVKGGVYILHGQLGFWTCTFKEATRARLGSMQPVADSRNKSSVITIFAGSTDALSITATPLTVGNANTDTDALNRGVADGRYAPKGNL